MSGSKTIWIINQYASTDTAGVAGRHYHLARQLAERGHRVYVIGASYTHMLRHPPHVEGRFKLEVCGGFTFVWLKMPFYSGAHSKKRVVGWFRFAWALRLLPKIIESKPDVILYSSLSLVGYLTAEHLAKRFRVPLVFEVRDIWPLTLLELGGVSKQHPFVRFLQWVEDRAYKNANAVISNLQNSVEHMVSRGMDAYKFSWIANGISLDEVSSADALDDGVSELIPKGKFVVGYTGSIGVANAMDTLIAAAELLAGRSDIAFVLVGNGDMRQQLENQVAQLGMVNVTFVDPIRKSQVQSMLGLFDACYIGWGLNDLYRFGIGANKLPEYLYSGKPVVHSYSGECDPIVASGAGVTVPARSPEQLAAAISRLADRPLAERLEMGVKGREYALRHYDYALLADKLLEVLFP